MRVTFTDDLVREYTFEGRALDFMDSTFVVDAEDRAYEWLRDSQTFSIGDGAYRPRTQVKEMQIVNVTDYEITRY